jgi:hypothetical protein
MVYLNKEFDGCRVQGRAATRIHERPDTPLLVASTLLVPGYIDAGEAGKIAAFVAGLDRGVS